MLTEVTEFNPLLGDKKIHAFLMNISPKGNVLVLLQFELAYNNVAVLLISNYTTVGWLVGWFLWHINLCRLFNAKSIFMQVSISNNSV